VRRSARRLRGEAPGEANGRSRTRRRAHCRRPGRRSCSRWWRQPLQRARGRQQHCACGRRARTGEDGERAVEDLHLDALERLLGGRAVCVRVCVSAPQESGRHGAGSGVRSVRAWAARGQCSARGGAHVQQADLDGLVGAEHGACACARRMDARESAALAAPERGGAKEQGATCAFVELRALGRAQRKQTAGAVVTRDPSTARVAAGRPAHPVRS
jgi:hypothetical protein